MKTVSVILPVMIANKRQEELARFAIKTMRMNTDVPFELVVVSTPPGNKQPGDYFHGLNFDIDRPASDIDVYVERPTRTNYTDDFNAGLRESFGDFKVHIGMDVIVGEGWLEAMLACFERFADCGVATVSCSEPGAHIGPPHPQATFDEAWYGPLMMFREGWTLDPAFPAMGGDNDLIMRHYLAGKRAYRNNAVRAFHLNGVTWFSAYKPEDRQQIEGDAREEFMRRYHDCGLSIYRIMTRGETRFGREWVV